MSLSDISTTSVTVNINQVENPGLSIEAKLLFLSPTLSQAQSMVKALHSFPQDADFVINFTVAVKHEGVAEV